MNFDDMANTFNKIKIFVANRFVQYARYYNEKVSEHPVLEGKEIVYEWISTIDNSEFSIESTNFLFSEGVLIRRWDGEEIFIEKVVFSDDWKQFVEEKVARMTAFYTDRNKLKQNRLLTQRQKLADQIAKLDKQISEES